MFDDILVPETDYDPRIRTLVGACDNDWGDPMKNRDSLIPYGILPIDKALYGIDPNGELVVIQGEEKNRKTTLVANVVANIMSRAKNPPVVNVDSLESGMRPEKYRDTLLSIVATRWLLEGGHTTRTACPACGTDKCMMVGISPKFLKYNSRKPEQMRAIEYAKETVSEWPLLLHGASVKQGNTRNLQEAAHGSKQQKARWLRLVEVYGMKILVVDHLQQYAFADEPTDYEKQIRAVSALGDFVSQYNIAGLALSQVSLTSVREVKAGGGKLVAAGGSKAAQEANTVFSASYRPGSGVMRIKIEESRDAGSFSVWQRLEDVSGCFYGEASTEPLTDE